MGRRAHAIDLRGGPAIPKLPPDGITLANIGKLPVVKTIEHKGEFFPGKDLNTYPILGETAQRNIYRIPLP